MNYRIAASKVAFPDGSVRTNHVVEIDTPAALSAWPTGGRAVRGRVTAHGPLVGETPRTLWWGGTLEVHDGFVILHR